MRFITKRIERSRAWIRRRARRGREAHGLVLMYHRVAAPAADPWQLAVAPETFDDQMEASLAHSSLRLENWLAASDTSPSVKAERGEQLLRLAGAVEALPEAQRQAILLHYFQQQSIAEIAQTLDRTPSAVAGLLHRGLKNLRGALGREASE